MREIHIYPEGALQVIELGRAGESLERQIVFHLEDWPEGAAFLLHRRREDAEAYPCVLVREEGVARWLVTALDTSQAGAGQAQLLVIRDGQTVKSQRFFTSVAEALPGTAPAETGTWDRAWLAALLAAAERVEQASAHAPVLRGGTWWVWDVDAGDYADTGVQAAAEPCQCEGLTDEEFDAVLDEELGPEEA